MKGRKKKPNELKKLAGSWRYDPNVPSADGKPRMPSNMSPGAKRIWSYLVPLLDAKGILDKTDLFILESFCREMATAREAQAILDRDGAHLAYQNPKSGQWFKNPYVLIAKDARAQAMRYASMLGITPVDRAKLSVPETKEPSLADQFEAAMRG